MINDNTDTIVYYLINPYDGHFMDIEYIDLRPGWNFHFKDFAARTYYSDARYSLVIL